MPRPLPPELVVPSHTALVVVECMNSTVGPASTIPGLAESARAEAIPNIARLIGAARAAQVPVLHCTVGFRADGLAANHNAPLFQRGPGGIERAPGATAAPGLDPTAVIDELRPVDTDIVLKRMHGIGPMGGTDLDGVLRNLGATTIIAVGVSVNVAVTNLVMDAVNLGYDVVLPRDAVAAIPREYADAVIRNTLSFLTTLTTTDDLVAAWTS
jgi:nicotinamidase-related amidase